MERMFLTVMFIVFFSPTVTNGFPCPSECICRPMAMADVDFTRMSYLIDCSRVSLNQSQLIYSAQPWSIDSDQLTEQSDDDDSTHDYAIAIDLSDSKSLKDFTGDSIRFTGFTYSIQSLSLTSQSKQFSLDANTFNSSLYQDLRVLNLSSCCKHTPNRCEQLLRPLQKLQSLDLSHSNLYQTCLGTPGRHNSHCLLASRISGETIEERGVTETIDTRRENRVSLYLMSSLRVSI